MKTPKKNSARSHARGISGLNRKARKASVPTEVDDIVQAAQMFHMFGIAFTLTYQTPSRIPPRMRVALDKLVADGVLDEIKEYRCDKTFSLTFKLKDAEKLKAIPKLSLAAVHAISNPLPVYSQDITT